MKAKSASQRKNKGLYLWKENVTVLISVIVPVYNGELYLERCIRSLIAQSIRDNLEIIIVNDGSKDATEKIAQNFCDNYSQIKLINKENAGLPQARKTGVENASGEYIGFVDVDDWVDIDMYETLYDACKENNADVVACDFYLEYEKESLPNDCVTKQQLVLSNEEALLLLHKRRGIHAYAWNKLYKKECFSVVEFRTGNFIGEDYDIVTKVLCNVKKVVWLPKTLYHYVMLEESMCHGGYSDIHIISYQHYYDNCQRLSDTYPEYKDYFLNYFLTEGMAFIIAMGRNDTYNLDLIKDTVRYGKKQFWAYLKAEYVEVKFKVSLLALCVHFKLLIKGYRFIGSSK